MQHRACCEIRRAKQDTVPSSLVGVGAWRAWYIGQIRLGRSLANSCIPTDCLVDRLSLGGQRGGFTPRASVSSSITHCYVVFLFASFFLTLLAFILLLCYIELRVIYLFICSLSLYSALSISQSKIYGAVICNLGSKQLLCCHTFQNIQLVSKWVHLFWFSYLSVILNPI